MTTFDDLDRNEVLDTIHAVEAEIPTAFTWDYDRTRPALGKLYEKAKHSQWNGSTDLDWSLDVDPEKVAAELGGGTVNRFEMLAVPSGLARPLLRRGGVDQGGRGDAELAAQPVHAR